MEVTSWGQVGAGIQAVDGNDTHGGHGYLSKAGTARVQG
jgi:hypothetical protein